MNGNFLVLRFFGHRRRGGRVGGAAELKSRSLVKAAAESPMPSAW